MRRRALLAVVAAVFLSPPEAGSGILRYDNAVIREDTTWSGTVQVTGQTVIKRGATLTILPGTTVAFAWSDDDGNGIGDGELNVEGRLVAAGTRERMITFTSARERPGKKDWTFVMLSMNRDSRVEHCLFEHAFTGLQAHLSSAVIRDNLFRGNFEAMRFSTADLVIEHNDIVENTYGIRYESRGSATTVAGNEFRGNEYAFFPVVRCTSEVKIFANCVVSSGYNVKMGQQQAEDLDFRSNWWGSADPGVIEEGFFDRRLDETLGRVLHQPFLDMPPGDCGRR